VLGVYILAFSLGVAVVALAGGAWRRLRVAYYGSFTLQFAGSTLIVLCEGIRTYNQATGGALSPSVGLVVLVLSLAGNAVLAWGLPLFCLHLVSAAVTRRRLLAHGALALALGAAGAAKEAFPGPLTFTINYLALFALYGYGCVILLRNFGRIEDAGLRRLTKSFLVLAGSLALPATVQLAIAFIPSVPDALRAYPYTQILYFLASVGLLLEHVARPPEAAASGFSCVLPPDFILRYGITPRECDIISMMEKGHSNSKLAEALFISTRTVKNHVYHIYQKTGAENKVQLINLVRTFQPNGNGGSPAPAAARNPSK
jgi:DNA-binding CsgD family transcriptional regulator